MYQISMSSSSISKYLGSSFGNRQPTLAIFCLFQNQILRIRDPYNLHWLRACVRISRWYSKLLRSLVSLTFNLNSKVFILQRQIQTWTHSNWLILGFFVKMCSLKSYIYKKQRQLIKNLDFSIIWRNWVHPSTTWIRKTE